MATKAELDAELTTLKREIKQRNATAEPSRSDVNTSEDADQTSEPEDLQQLLDEHGINEESVKDFKANLLKELTELQKEKPLVALVAVLAVGIIIGRTFK
jgi:hypothetical protein